jgi:hypothetical protein
MGMGMGWLRRQSPPAATTGYMTRSRTQQQQQSQDLALMHLYGDTGLNLTREQEAAAVAALQTPRFDVGVGSVPPAAAIMVRHLINQAQLSCCTIFMLALQANRGHEVLGAVLSAVAARDSATLALVCSVSC